MIKIPKRYGFNVTYLGKQIVQHDMWINPRHIVAIVNTWATEDSINTTLVMTSGSHLATMSLDLHKEFIDYIEEKLDEN